MREDYQRKRQFQPPVRGQSLHPPVKKPYQGPSKGPTQQGQQQHRPQGQQRPQQQVPAIATVESEKLRQFTDGLRPDIRHDVKMADMETYMAEVNRAYRSERGRRDMREDYQRKRQFQPPVRGQSLHPPAKKPYQGPSKGPTQQGQQQHRPQGQQRPQQQGSSAPKPGGYQTYQTCKE
ncbi:hypothetical protein F511_38955 [Dorcoceras hygrometricum]|uniref:Uncharacterized protein n=1 Tax=Dorcoceras hygrometricum TaxID=472368 RepID=A0A2Z7CTA1_9LAMI|nr:hypothetical protein F511_38955 [Dorcoceras hygrometricum]